MYIKKKFIHTHLIPMCLYRIGMSPAFPLCTHPTAVTTESRPHISLHLSLQQLLSPTMYQGKAITYFLPDHQPSRLSLLPLVQFCLSVLVTA